MTRNILEFEHELAASWRDRVQFVVPTFCAAFASATLNDYVALVRREGWGDDAFLSQAIESVWDCIGDGSYMYDAARTLEKLVQLAPNYDDFGDDAALYACQFAHYAVTSTMPNADSAPALNLVSCLHSGVTSRLAKDLVDDETYLDCTWKIPEVQALAAEVRNMVAEILPLKAGDIPGMRKSLTAKARAIVRLSDGA